MKLRYSCVYVWNLIGTDKYYVGQTIDGCARTLQHIASAEDPNCNTKWAKALRDNGVLSFRIVRGEPCRIENLDELEVKLIQEYNAYYDGFNSTRGNHWDKKVVKGNRAQRMLPVVGYLARTVYRRVKHYKNKRVLIIGTFDSFIIKTLVENDCDVTVIANVPTADDCWVDDTKYCVLAANNDILMKKLDEVYMKSEKFDLVIANPPYGIGNKVIFETMKHCDRAVVLMPITKYNGKDLHRKLLVDTVERVDPKFFREADVDRHLCVSTLVNNYDNGLDYQMDVEEIVYDSQYRDYYHLNKRTAPTFVINSGADNGEKMLRIMRDENIDIETSMMFGQLALGDGVHKSGCDVRYNLENTITKMAGGCFVLLNTPEEKQNMATWWYYNPEAAKLIRGVNRGDCKVNIVIPHIDWSKPRDYAKLTVEDLMYILENEL